jgi:hypothetical protein
VSLLGGVLLTLACGEGDERARLLGSGENTEWCLAACNTFGRCSADVGGDCVDVCQRNQRGYFRRVTEQALHEEALCLPDKACSADPDELFTTCFVEVGQVLEITSEATGFCDSMADTFFGCAWYSTPSQCSQQNARFTGAALSAGARCAGTPCDDLESCIEATLWTFGD